VKVARFCGRGVVELAEDAEPRPADEEVVLEVLYSAFCGSDKRLLRDGASHVPGHEIVGRIVSPDHARPGLQSGQNVAVYIPLFCGECPQCVRGACNRCVNLRGLVGWQTDGGFAERIRVPVRNLLPIPEDIPPRRAVLALDTLGTAANGLDLAVNRMDSSERVALVIGCGPLGLGTVAVARQMGLDVLACDVSAHRIEMAVALGAEPFDLPEGAHSGRSGPFPLIVEASGASDAKSMASELVDQGGVVLMLGEGNDPWSLPATVKWRRTEACWVRSFYFPLTQVDTNWQLVRTTGAALEELLLTYVPFTKLPSAAAAFMRGELTKPVVRFGA
jgi:threonine dehydrogenase-like Zn-dependent dehydrogenase